MLTTIANIGSMKVISRTSVMEYKGTTKKIPEIARELGVANILEGGVQRSGNQARINVQLIDAETDEHLWAEIYDRKLTAENLFVIQSEVSNAIAQALHMTLSPEEQQRVSAVPTQSLEAYEAYMLGRQQWVARTADSTAEAVTHFQRAVDLDPDYSAAYNWLGLNHNYRGEWEEAIEVFRKGLAVDPLSPVLHSNIASNNERLGFFEESRQGFERLTEISPESTFGYDGLGDYHQFVEGRLDKALVLYHKQLDLDPGEVSMPADLANVYLNLGDPQSAEYWIGRAMDIRATNIDVSSARMSLALYNGENDRAVSFAREAEELAPYQVFNPWLLTQLYVADLADGNGTVAVERYAATFQTLMNPGEHFVSKGDFYVVSDIVYLLRQTGDDELVLLVVVFL